MSRRNARCCEPDDWNSCRKTRTSDLHKTERWSQLICHVTSALWKLAVRFGSSVGWNFRCQLALAGSGQVIVSPNRPPEVTLFTVCTQAKQDQD
ncbi:hypothetical protein BaRGS_00017260 [Batillaria attramentaria]|uniref:Uncharacterized protein n=1 Tax=Batillaria attramentaria TaxID=370345 RepID=A0ABD0KWJ6_9CAEN